MLQIVIGLLGLGLMVLIHELGHFICARLNGITVEAFSIGWGPKLLSWRRGNTDYRLSLLPLGGYCKMKGEEMFKQAIESNADSIMKQPGSLYAASPLKRIATYFSGPLANFLFAILAFSLVLFIGYRQQNFDSRIVVTKAGDEHPEPYPAEKAGLLDGDRIIAIDGQPTAAFTDLAMIISARPEQSMLFRVRRGDETIELEIVSEISKDYGNAVIGITPWIEPVVGAVNADSAAAVAGLRSGDRLLEINGQKIINSQDFFILAQDNPSRLQMIVEREQQLFNLMLIPLYAADSSRPDADPFGFSFAVNMVNVNERNPIKALAAGAGEAVSTLYNVAGSLPLLFSGIDLQKSVAGPLRITYMIGESAYYAFSYSVLSGLTQLLRFIALISVALFFMNLLPIPLLDGGAILITVIELIKRGNIRPKMLYRYQMIGMVIVLMLLLLTVFSDILFFVS